jgi:arylsulfatase B/arylsulfatase I/J
MLCTQLCFFLCVAFVCVAYQQSPKPNILFILADDYGFHDIGYHDSEIKTPVLDMLASQGVKLENYYVQSTCTPTRSQLLSGRYQIHTGMQGGIIWPAQPSGHPLNDTFLPQKLKDEGYATHAVGKWHLGFYKASYMPTRRGFDSFYGYLTGAEDYFSHTAKAGFPMWKEWKGLDFHRNEQVVRNENGIYSTHLFTKEVINIIDQHNTSQPLFIYLPFQAVHGPLQVPDSYMEPYKHIKNKDRRTYAGMVSAMDEAVGNITEALHKKGIMDNTVIIFSSDNGGRISKGGNNWPLRGWKSSLWEGGIRAVGFVHSNKLENHGSVSRALMHVTDWYPTIVHLAGGDITDLTLDGYNQWDAISHGAQSRRREILHNINPVINMEGVHTQFRAAIRVGDLKLLIGEPGNGSWIPPPDMACPGQCHHPTIRGYGTWLFNITADPEERNDLSSVYPDRVAELMSRLETYNRTAVPVYYPPPDHNANPALHDNVWLPWES